MSQVFLRETNLELRSPIPIAIGPATRIAGRTGDFPDGPGRRGTQNEGGRIHVLDPERIPNGLQFNARRRLLRLEPDDVVLGGCECACGQNGDSPRGEIGNNDETQPNSFNHVNGTVPVPVEPNWSGSAEIEPTTEHAVLPRRKHVIGAGTIVGNDGLGYAVSVQIDEPD